MDSIYHDVYIIDPNHYIKMEQDIDWFG